MRFNIQQAVRALILFSFSGLIFHLHYSGNITKLINPKYETLSLSAAILFFVLFLIQLTRIWKVKGHTHDHCHHEEGDCSHHHDHGDEPINFKKLVSYTILVLPLLTGFLLPVKILDASIVNKKGGMEVFSNKARQPKGSDEKQSGAYSELTEEELLDPDIVEKVPDDTIFGHAADPALDDTNKDVSEEEYNKLISKLEKASHIELNDYVFGTYYDEMHRDISKYRGKTIKLKGFVYKEEGFKENQLVVSRFLITHCIADASIIGFLSEFSGAANLKEDTWIEAEGQIELTNYNGTELPIIKVSNWEKVNEPKEPYLYPINIKIF